jgi:hypothetical protein
MRRGTQVLGGALVAAMLALPADGRAQQDTGGERDRVMAVVDGLFEAMRSADSAAVRALFHPELRRMATSGAPDGEPVVMFGDLDGFARAVGGASPGDLDERLGPADVRIDDNLATVFTPYAFHYKGQLSHCGVNVFLIARTGADWKIVGLADTRRKEGCEEWLK